MKRLRNVFSVYAAFGFVFLLLAAQAADAQNRRNEREVRDIVRSLNSKVEDFKYGLTYQMRSSSADAQEIEDVTADLDNLQDQIRLFSENLDQRRENAGDVNQILEAARGVEDFLASNPQNRKIENDWSTVRNLLDRLAASYNIPRGGATSGNRDYPNDNFPSDNFPNDTGSRYPNNLPSNASSFGLTGTYRLDASRSENTADIIADARIRNESDRQDLQSKLDAPEQIAIDVRGNQISLASSKASPVTFAADGSTRTENLPDGRSLRLRAAMSGETLTVSSLGGDTDYTITFVSTDGGRTLKVTRRITTNYLDQTVFAESVYTKTDQIARLGIENGNVPNDSGTYSSNDPRDDNNSNSGYPTTSSGRRGEYIVPNGTIVTGILENEITTRISQNNDRFRMTIQTPDQFRGAVVTGYISGINRSGKVSGRSQITFNFEQITLRNGQTYDFAGYLQSVTDAEGKTVRVDTEGAAKGDSQTKETVKRGGIGAGIGAIIGAIAGGAKGAAIGAIIGGGAGAGSVIVQGKDDLDLKKGSTITVQASSPIR